MKFSYKWPSISSNTPQQAIFTNKKTNKEVHTSNETLSIGIATALFYFFTIIYIYVSGAINNNSIPFSINSPKEFISSMMGVKEAVVKSIKDLSIFNLNTLSSSFKGSERIGTTVCLMIFLALLQTLFSYQNIYSNDIKRAPVIAFNYVIILCWFLFLYIFPSKMIGKQEKSSKAHLFLAICALVSIIINCFLLANLYSEYFDEKTIEPLSGIGYALVAFLLFSGITMICNVHIGGHLAHEAVAYSEMICLILFGIFLILFTQFPPLPSDQLSCVMIPSP